MEIAKEHANIITRASRLIHFSIQHFIEKKGVKNATAYVASSEISRKHNSELYGNTDKPFLAPHSGVKYKELQGGKDLKIKGTKMLFISAGTEKIRKGIVHLEKALPVVFKKHPELKLMHVGKKFVWDVPDWCKKRIISYGRVPWNEIKDYYKTADFLVTCSLNELIPNIVFEAMAAGCPVLSSDMIGMDEVINHKKTGLIYERGNVKELIENISYMYENKQKRKQMTILAKKKAKQISYDVFSKKLLTFMENTLQGKKQNSIHLLR
jgi:glycosyltransferase involved in cell wall biosynthesis